MCCKRCTATALFPRDSPHWIRIQCLSRIVQLSNTKCTDNLVHGFLFSFMSLPFPACLKTTLFNITSSWSWLSSQYKTAIYPCLYSYIACGFAMQLKLNCFLILWHSCGIPDNSHPQSVNSESAWCARTTLWPACSSLESPLSPYLCLALVLSSSGTGALATSHHLRGTALQVISGSQSQVPVWGAEAVMLG